VSAWYGERLLVCGLVFSIRGDHPCGTAVAFRAEGLPGVVGMPVGCFADPDFAKPSKMFWASRRHRWLDLPDDIAMIETQ